MNFISRLLGFDHVRSIDSVEWSLAAPWAMGRGWLVLACCVAILLAAFYFYARLEEKRSAFVTKLLAALRAALLILLVLTLAAPLLRSSATTERRPRVLVVIDNTQSMTLAAGDANDSRKSRLERVAELAVGEASLLERLAAQSDYQLSFATFSGEQQQPLETVTRPGLSSRLTGHGTRTDLNAVLKETAARAEASSLAAVILVSDFVHNSASALSSERDKWLEDFPVPIWTIGIGQTNPSDIAVAIRGEPKARLGQTLTLQIDLSQLGLTGRQAKVTVQARALTRTSGSDSSPRLVYSGDVALSAESQTIEVPFTPAEPGPIELTAAVEPFAAELLPQNNTAVHRVEVIADHLRMLYVEQEPSWEWRFVKEVFQRDELIGRDGFRTFLASADPAVWRTNALFLPELAASRAEFLATDMVLLGDVPAETLTADFCNLLEEYVGDFGGSLVVLAGPRFGPTVLLDTPIAGMLPVHLDAESRLRDQREFALRRTKAAERYPFMTLADSPQGNDRAWRNLQSLPWYFPVAAVHEQAEVLAEHPEDLTADGRTHQPLIAIRPYGNGQVVYIAFNELWRLRSGVGQAYHQRLWAQLAYRLGMSHPVGKQKRFVVRVEGSDFRAGDTARISVDAFDEDFQPLDRELSATLLASTGSGSVRQTLSLVRKTASRYEAECELKAAGEYRLEITDPVTNEVQQEVLRVSAGSREFQNPARDAQLQSEIAERTGGHSYAIADADLLLEELRLQPTVQREQRVVALWHTPLWFVLVAGLMLSEWTVRRWVHLR